MITLNSLADAILVLTMSISNSGVTFREEILDSFTITTEDTIVIEREQNPQIEELEIEKELEEQVNEKKI